jgi:hypothetical protein
MITVYRALCVFLILLQPHQDLGSKEKPPNDSHFSIRQITIGKDNFKNLQDKLGPTKKCHTKRHDGVDVAGYADPEETLVFEFGEIGGGDVTAFSLSLPSGTTECPLSPLPAGVSHLATNGGIRLGMTGEEFVSIFGDPQTKTGSDFWKYEWTLDAKYTEAEKKAAAAAGHPVPDTYVVGITVEAKFKDGKLTYFYVAKLEST